MKRLQKVLEVVFFYAGCALILYWVVQFATPVVIGGGLICLAFLIRVE
jgi:hypothetical protein